MIEREADRMDMYRNAAARIEQRSEPAPERSAPPRERETSGQFAPAERPTGREAEERAAGYKPLKEERSEPEGLTVRDAATDRAKELQERPIEVHESGLKDNVTLSAEQAAKRIAEAREADAAQAELDGTKAAQKAVDDLRNASGVEPQPQPIDTEAEFDIAKAHPKVRDAILSKFTEAETQRQHFETSVKEVGKMRIAALAADFPELVKLPLNQWAAAINNLAKSDLPKARQIATRLQALGEVEAAVQQIEQQKTARQQNEFKAYSAKETARFRELTKGIPPQQMEAIKAEVPGMLKAVGVSDPHAFLKAIEGQTTFPRASAEMLLIYAARYMMMQKAAKAQPTRVLPPVQRPGVAAPRGNSASTALAALNQKLSQTGDIKDATALLMAKRKATRR